jgi:hypothetical protein
MITLECDQLSPEWYAARAGIPTASHFDKIITSTGAPSKQAQKYMFQLAGERITGTKEETYQNATMQRGLDLESEAKELYEAITGQEVSTVGLCYKNEARTASCSPDGLIGEAGGYEVKCPLIHTHVSYLLKNKLPTEYIHQVQGSMYVTGRDWWEFMSYYPGLKPLIVRVERDPIFIGKLHRAITEFNEELNEIVRRIS